ncbi:hypothetical protein [Streptomyces sp. NPDC056323]|uniref:hypothetical protein n=1 Tax=Streptomyces sp. NPDC056323 TaxID=3345784 RepID=UPI0035E170D8
MTTVYGTRSTVFPVSRSHRPAASTPRRQYAPSGSMTRSRTNWARTAGSRSSLNRSTPAAAPLTRTPPRPGSGRRGKGAKPRM